MNVVLLVSTFGCHSGRHVFGGHMDEVSKSGVRSASTTASPASTSGHAVRVDERYAVAFADIYVRLCSMGIRSDWRSPMAGHALTAVNVVSARRIARRYRGRECGSDRRPDLQVASRATAMDAEGGMAAALAHNDDRDNSSVADTMRGGEYINNWRMAELHAKAPPTGCASWRRGARSSIARRTDASTNATSAATATRVSRTSAIARVSN